MLTKTNVRKLLFCIFTLMLFSFSKMAYANWSVGVSVGGPGYYHDDRRFYGWHDHPHYGWHFHHLPPRYFTLWVGGVRYYYYDGLYYNYVGDGDYVLIDPPIGAHVDVIPPDFQPVSINGRIYYTNNGVYYILTEHHGYKVVEAPVVYEQPAPTVVTEQAPVPVAAQDSFPVNIPNNNGSYTTIVLKRSGTGYVGPQGEFYATFPSVAQLKAMYVK